MDFEDTAVYNEVARRLENFDDMRTLFAVLAMLPAERKVRPVQIADVLDLILNNGAFGTKREPIDRLKLLTLLAE